MTSYLVINNLHTLQNYSTASFNKMPIELCLAIFSALPCIELIPLRLTCKSWHIIINQMIDPRLSFIDEEQWQRCTDIPLSPPPIPNNVTVNKIIRKLSKYFDPISKFQAYSLVFMPRNLHLNVVHQLLNPDGTILLDVNFGVINKSETLNVCKDYLYNTAVTDDSYWVLIGEFGAKYLETIDEDSRQCEYKSVEQRAFSDWSAKGELKWRKGTLIELLVCNIFRHLMGKSHIRYDNYFENRVILKTPIQEVCKTTHGHLLSKPMELELHGFAYGNRLTLRVTHERRSPIESYDGYF